MTVSTINSVAEFVTNGTTKSFPFYFKFLDGRDLVVTYINPEEVSTILTMGTQYTVSGAGNENGGSITTTATLAGPGKLIVFRDMEAYQKTSLRNQGKFLAETHEDVFDRLTMLSQQGFAGLKRALARPFGREYFDAEENRITGLAEPKSPQDAATKVYADGVVAGAISYTDSQLLSTIRSTGGETLTQLPPAASRANKVMGFDGAGQPIGVLPASGSGTELAIDLAYPVDPRKGAGMVARAQRMINSIQELAGLIGRYANEAIKLASWHAGLNCGGGDLFWSPTTAKSKHDGGMVFSPSVPWSDNPQSYLNGVGELDAAGAGCWVRPDSEYWCEMFGAVPFVNDGRQGIDATIPIQKALYSAKRNAVLLTHSISDLRPVKGGGMFLVQGILYFPEGVVWEGTDMIATGFAFGWAQTTKISGYGKLHDTLNGNTAGTTFTKNWGLKNMTMAPYYYESGPSSCVYLDLVRDIEPRLQDVRFIMHKGAVKGGQLNATAVRFTKVEDPDFNNITMDGGSNHLYTAFGVEWGVRKARISRAYSYNARDNAVFLASASSKNKIEIEIQMAEQVGSNYGVNIEDGFDNRVDITASGSKLRYGAILNGHDNVVIGTINDALLSTVEVRGEGNQAILSYSGPSPVDTGKNSVILSSQGIKVAGVSQGNKSGLSLTTVNTWYDVAKISFASGEAAAAVLKASIAMEVVGVGRDCFVGQWLVQTSATGVVGSTFNASSKFSASNSIEMQVVAAGSNSSNLQVRTVLGASASGDVQFSLSGDSKVTVRAL